MCQKFSLGELYILHELMKRNETQYNMHCKLEYCWLHWLTAFWILQLLLRRGYRKYTSMQERESTGMHVHSCITVIIMYYIYANRKTLRLAASLLHKVVDSLAPALTSMLVRGKEVQLYAPYFIVHVSLPNSLLWFSHFHHECLSKIDRYNMDFVVDLHLLLVYCWS